FTAADAATIALSATRASGEAVGTYATTATATGAALSNYTVTYVPGSFTITTAVLTVTADDQTSAYGAANPPLTARYTGFVNGDTAASLTTPASVTTIATTASAVGTYAIMPSGAASLNYTMRYVNGTLTVTPATLTVTANNKTRVYGAANPTLTAGYSGVVNG